MTLKFYEQMNEIGKEIKQDKSLTEQQKEQELKKLNAEIKRIID